MNMSNKAKRESPLVKSVLALDNYLTELERVGMKINSTDMTSDFDIEFVHKLLTRFAECGQGISEEVANLSAHLHEAQARAEAVAQGVSKQAEKFQARKKEQDEKLEEFRLLGEKVRNLSAAIGELRGTKDREKLTSNLPVFETQLTGLIEDLQKLRQSARESRMRGLEKNAESLVQTLQTVRKKLSDLR
jgi:chromosome segregation ATPase